ncbi:hypothetical protein ACAW74_13895 [Fibrella sp. WM1]|uniref:hypothetical protein n=1 Tax=Fibrella musci TaxID=3242485 RepID=UPI0035225E67
MALAFLTFDGCDDTTCRFRADIGTNRLHRYVIGQQKSMQHGIERVDAVVYESPLIEAPDANPLRPEFTFEVDAARFTDENGRRARYLQLFSYADQTGRAEAISDVVTVETLFRLPDSLRLPRQPQPLTTMQSTCNCRQTTATRPMTYPMSLLESAIRPDVPDDATYPAYTSGQSLSHDGVRRIACAYQVAPVSRAMFWDALLEAAKLLVPAVVGAVSGGSGAGGAGLGNVSGQDILQTVTQILNALAPTTPASPAAIPVPATPTTPATGTTPAVAPPTPAPTAAVAPARAASLSTTGRATYLGGAYGRQLPRALRAQPRATRARYGSAMIIDGGILTGPLLASLLGPVLQQAPQLLQTVLDSPLKLFNAITARKLGQQQLEQNYLTGLLANISQRDLMNRLVASGLLSQQPATALSMSAAASRSLQLDFALTNPIQVAGKPRFVFMANGGITLPLQLISTGAPPAFPKLIVQLQLKDSRTLTVLAEKRYRLKDVPTNGLLPLSLSPDELRTVPRNQDVLVGASLIWQTQSGTRTAGTYSNQFIYLSDGYMLDRVGEELAAPKPLNNPVAHRVFWHKVWEGGGDNRRWQLALTGKYLYVYAPTADTNGRMETKFQLSDEAVNDTDRLTLAGKLKTGLEVSPNALNELLPSLGAYPSLTSGQLAALRTDDLDPQMNQEATARLELKGKRDERGVLWVYPDVVVHSVTLARINQTDANGQATQTQAETVAFPRIQACHFVGAKTESNGY